MNHPKNHPTSNSDPPSQDASAPDVDDFDRRGEWISAYLDGEATPAEATQVERWLAEDPAAAEFAQQLRSVQASVRRSFAVSATPEKPNRSGPNHSGPNRSGKSPAAFQSDVVAEALRRRAAGEVDTKVDPVELPDRLEPEGEFGLPFGGSARRWAWAGVAAAAAVLIGFYGRPGTPATNPIAGSGSPDSVVVATTTGRPQLTSQQRLALRQRYEQGLRAMRQAAPGLQVVNYQATPATLQRLQQRLAQRPAQLPGELLAAKQQGVVVEPVEPATEPLEDGEEQLFYIDANEAELTQLLSEVESGQADSVYRVGADQPGSSADTAATNHNRPTANQTGTKQPTVGATPTKQIRAVRFRLNLTPEDAAKLAKAQAEARANGGSGRRLVVLRIQVKRSTPAE